MCHNYNNKLDREIGAQVEPMKHQDRSGFIGSVVQFGVVSVSKADMLEVDRSPTGV